jgi:hypothetical protein
MWHSDTFLCAPTRPLPFTVLKTCCKWTEEYVFMRIFEYKRVVKVYVTRNCKCYAVGLVLFLA